MQLGAAREARNSAPYRDHGDSMARVRLEPARDRKEADPARKQLDVSAAIKLDAEMVRRLHAEDPFFRARADRYALLDDLVRDQEATAEAKTTARKYIEMLKKRRDLILLELVDLIAEKSPAKPDAIWKAPLTQRRPVPASSTQLVRSWRWP